MDITLDYKTMEKEKAKYSLTLNEIIYIST
jgi:hypothetical protein